MDILTLHSPHPSPRFKHIHKNPIRTTWSTDLQQSTAQKFPKTDLILRKREIQVGSYSDLIFFSLLVNNMQG